MELPKFLIADNSDLLSKIFILHTEYPRFLLDVETEEIEWLDDLEEDSETNLNEEVANLIDESFAFFDREMEGYED